MKTKTFYLMVTGKDVENYDTADHLIVDREWVGVVSSCFQDVLRDVADVQGLKNYKIVEGN